MTYLPFAAQMQRAGDKAESLTNRRSESQGPNRSGEAVDRCDSLSVR